MMHSQTQSSYPLSWPAGWARTKLVERQDARFFTSTRGETRPTGWTPVYRQKRSMNSATNFLTLEMDRLGASALVVSTNVELRQDGLPYSNRKPPEDSGAAVYFKFSGKPVVLACDKWKRVEDNLWAIAKDIEAQRGRARWGVGNLEQAFAGYLRLAAPGESGAALWYNVLGISAECSFEQARAAYIERAKVSHQDMPGGSHESMVYLNKAWDQARQHFSR